MIRTGNKMVFEAASHGVAPEVFRTGDRKLVVVWFDGEPELWTVPNAQGDYAKAIAEIKEYYQHWWRGTDRMLPMTVHCISEYFCIQC